MATYVNIQVRDYLISVAENLYIKTGITSNISDAIQLLQNHLPLESKHLLNKITRKQDPRVFNVKEMNLPVCEKCNGRMHLFASPVTIDGIYYPTTWKCGECGAKEFSTYTIEEWRDIFQGKKELTYVD